MEGERRAETEQGKLVWSEKLACNYTILRASLAFAVSTAFKTLSNKGGEKPMLEQFDGGAGGG
jgi:hypothetical protein